MHGDARAGVDDRPERGVSFSRRQRQESSGSSRRYGLRCLPRTASETGNGENGRSAGPAPDVVRLERPGGGGQARPSSDSAALTVTRRSAPGDEMSKTPAADIEKGLDPRPFSTAMPCSCRKAEPLAGNQGIGILPSRGADPPDSGRDQRLGAGRGADRGGSRVPG